MVESLACWGGHLGNSGQGCCFIASGSAASACRLVRVQFVQVIGCDLFTRRDFSEGINEDPAVGDDYARVRLTRMIDVLSAVAAPASVNGPFVIHITDALFARLVPSALSFSQWDPLAHVLSNLLVLVEGNAGETAFSVDSGFSNREPERKFRRTSLGHYGKLLSLASSISVGAQLLWLVVVKEDRAVGAVYELAGLGLLDLRARHGHVASRTAVVLNEGEGA